MKLRKSILLSITPILLVAFIILSSCSDGNFLSPDFSEEVGINECDINFLEWNSDAAVKINSDLNGKFGKIHKDVQTIYSETGGVVGGDNTFGCRVYVPAGAFAEDSRIIKAKVTAENGNIAGVDFLPSQTFDKDVTITLPFEYLNIDENSDLDNLKGFWFNEETQLWIEVPYASVDKEAKEVSIKINHFTRFGWGMIAA